MSEGAGRNDDRIGGGKKRATRRARERGAWILDFGKEKKIASFKTQTPRAPASSRASSSLAGDARAARRSRGSTRPRVASRSASIDVLAEDAPGVRREALARGASRLLPRRRERLGRPDARGADAHARAPSGDAPRGGRGVRRARGAPVRARARGPRPRRGRGLARAPVARRGDARTTPRDTFQNLSSTSAFSAKRFLIHGKKPPRASAHAPSLPSSRRTSASSRTPRATRSTPPPPPRASRRTPPRRRGAAAPSRAARPRRCGNGETRSPPPTPRESASPSPSTDAAPSATRSTRQKLAAPRTTTETTPGTPSDAPCERKAKRRAERRFRRRENERRQKRTTAATAPGRDPRTPPRAPRGRLPRRRPRRSAR